MEGFHIISPRHLKDLVIFSVALVAVAANLAIGGGDNSSALFISSLYGLTLAGIMLSRWGRSAAVEIPEVWLPILMFLLVIIAACTSIVPMVLDGPHPIWAAVDAPSRPSIDISRTLLELIKLSSVACFFTAGFLIGKSNSRARNLLRFVTVLSGLYGLWAFLSYIISPSSIMGIGTKVLFPDRLTASFLSANTAGTFFGMMTMVATEWLLRSASIGSADRSGRPLIAAVVDATAIPAITLLIFVTDLLLTVSRTAILATAFVLFLFLLAEGIDRRWKGKFLVVIMIPLSNLLAGMILMFSGGRFIDRLPLIQNESATRIDIYIAHIPTIKSSVIQGFGIGNFELINRQVTTQNNFNSIWNVRAMHNVYLQWLQGGGVIGALPMAFCIISILGMIICALWRGQRMQSELRLCLAMSAVICLHGSTDFALENPSIAGFWALFLGVGAALATDKAPTKLILSGSPLGSS